MPVKRKEGISIGDDAVRKRTGKGWKEWFAILDKWGAPKYTHTEIATYLYEKLEPGGWWAQMIAAQYERERGLRDIGQMRGGQYSVDVQRTIAATPRKAYDAFIDPKHRSVWFIAKSKADLKVGGAYGNAAGDKGKFLALTPPKRVRFSWENEKHCPGTVVEAVFTPLATGKVAIRISHSKLANQKDRAKMKDGWSWALDSLKSYLETDRPIKRSDWKRKT